MLLLALAGAGSAPRIAEAQTRRPTTSQLAQQIEQQRAAQAQLRQQVEQLQGGLAEAETAAAAAETRIETLAGQVQQLQTALADASDQTQQEHRIYWAMLAVLGVVVLGLTLSQRRRSAAPAVIGQAISQMEQTGARLRTTEERLGTLAAARQRETGTIDPGSAGTG